jgi:uncharacterized membrane protein
MQTCLRTDILVRLETAIVRLDGLAHYAIARRHVQVIVRAMVFVAVVRASAPMAGLDQIVAARLLLGPVSMEMAPMTVQREIVCVFPDGLGRQVLY